MWDLGRLHLLTTYPVVVAVQVLSHVQLSATPGTAARQVSLSFTISWSLRKFMSTESVILSNHLILCHPLLLSPSIFPNIRVPSHELALRTRQPKYWNISLSSEYSGLISLRTGLISLQSKGLSESPPAPWFEGINSSALSLFYCPAFISVHDYWKNHSFDYTDICRQSDISAF